MRKSSNPFHCLCLMSAKSFEDFAIHKCPEMSASRPFPASLQAVEWAQVVDDVGPVEEPKQPGTALSCKDWSGQEMCCVLHIARAIHHTLRRAEGSSNLASSPSKDQWPLLLWKEKMTAITLQRHICPRLKQPKKSRCISAHKQSQELIFYYLHISYSISLRASLNLKHQTSPWKSWSGASVAFSCTTELSRRFTSKTSASLLRDPQRSAAGHAVCSFELHGGPPAATSISMNQLGHWAIGNQPSISLNCTAIWHVVERRILAHLHADVFSTDVNRPACEFISKDSQTKEWSSNIALCLVFLFKSWSFVGYTSATPAAATLAALSEIGSEVKMDLQFMHFHLKRERSRKERGLKREQVRGEGREEKTNGREREERITSSSAKRHGLWHHKRNLDIQWMPPKVDVNARCEKTAKRRAWKEGTLVNDSERVTVSKLHLNVL